MYTGSYTKEPWIWILISLGLRIICWVCRGKIGSSFTRTRDQSPNIIRHPFANLMVPILLLLTTLVWALQKMSSLLKGGNVGQECLWDGCCLDCRFIVLVKSCQKTIAAFSWLYYAFASMYLQNLVVSFQLGFTQPNFLWNFQY